MIPFDKEAIDYDKWYDTKLGNLVDTVETELVMDMLLPKKDMRILDAGCGTGNFSFKLAKKGCMITGVDISENMLKIADNKKEKSGLPVEFIKADSRKLPFSDNTFDAAVSVVAVEFIDDVRAVIDELLRVTKQNGKVVVGTINRESDWGKLYESDFFQENTVFKHARFLDKTTLTGIRKNEFIEVKECLFFSPDTEEQKLDINLERKTEYTGQGGFICALWKK